MTTLDLTKLPPLNMLDAVEFAVADMKTVVLYFAEQLWYLGDSGERELKGFFQREGVSKEAQIEVLRVEGVVRCWYKPPYDNETYYHHMTIRDFCMPREDILTLRHEEAIELYKHHLIRQEKLAVALAQNKLKWLRDNVTACAAEFPEEFAVIMNKLGWEPTASKKGDGVW